MAESVFLGAGPYLWRTQWKAARRDARGGVYQSVSDVQEHHLLQNWDPENDGLRTLDTEHRRLTVSLGGSIQIDWVRRRRGEIGR